MTKKVVSPSVKEVMFRIVRDTRPIEEKVKERFYFTNPNITSQNFRVVPLGGPNPEEAVLVNFGEDVTSEDAVARLDKMGLRPGLPTELVDLFKSHPDSKQFVVALGDSWVDLFGYLRVAYLFGAAEYTGLLLDLWSSKWHDYWWFLAFRK